MINPYFAVETKPHNVNDTAVTGIGARGNGEGLGVLKVPLNILYLSKTKALMVKINCHIKSSFSVELLNETKPMYKRYDCLGGAVVKYASMVQFPSHTKWLYGM